MRAWARTHVGQVRATNEDAYWMGGLSSPPGAFFAAVADGMGGHQWGEVASQVAVGAARRALESAAAQSPDLGALVRAAVVEANRAVLDAAAATARPGLPMGTTLSCVLAVGDRAAVGHIGDSRAYLVRGGAARLLTDDHSLVGELLRNGDITEREAMVHPHRNVLTRALGGERGVDPDVTDVGLEAADRLVLCTDGLTSLVTAGEIAAVVAAAPAEAPERLVALANERGGHDNVTVIVLEHAG